MIKIGRFTFKTETEFFQYTMKRYFRKVPPVPTNIYLNQTDALKIEHRVKLAKICHFPSIINTLYRDENPQVRKAVESNDFWVLIGKIQDVLGFDKKERKQFARSEFNKMMVVLLMFEDDIEILSETLMNPSVSIKMITTYIELLQKPKDVIVLGSSRSMQIGKQLFDGFDFFNNAVSGGSLEDHLAIYAMYRQHDLLPGTVILGLDPWIFNANNGQTRWHSIAPELFRISEQK